MGLEQLKQDVLHRTVSFGVRYEGSITYLPELNPPRCVVKAVMIDLHHDLVLYIGVNLATIKIDDIGVEFFKTPFPDCMKSFDKYQEFIGIDMSDRKIMQKLLEFEKLNCLHLNELFQIASKTFTSGFAFFLKDQFMPEEMDEYKMHKGDTGLEERLEINRHWWMKDSRVKDSCYAYRENSIRQNYNEKVKSIPTITKLMIQASKKNRQKS